MAGKSRLDALRDSFKDAQTAKTDLDGVLNETRRIRRDLEITAEKEENKMKQIKAVHAEKAESLKVAQHKRAQSQTLSESLRSTVEEKKTCLANIVKQVEAEDEEKSRDIHEFEDLVSKLAAVVMKAKSYYAPENIQKSISEKQMQYDSLHKENEQLDTELDMLTSYINSLDGQVEQSCEDDSIDKKTIWKVLEEDLKQTSCQLERITTEQICPC